MKDTFLAIYRKVKDVFIRPKLRWYFGPWKYEPNLPVWRSGPKIGRFQLPIWLSFHWFNDDLMYKTKFAEDDYRFEFPPHITLVIFGYAISVTAYIPKEYEKDYTCEDDYWTSVLTYIHYNGDLKKTNDVMGYYNDIYDDSFQFCFNPRFIKDPIKQKELTDIQLNKLIELYNEPIPIKCIAISTQVADVKTKQMEPYITTYKGRKLLFDDVNVANSIIQKLKPIETTQSGRKKKVSFGLLYFKFKDIDEFNEIMNKKQTKPLYKSAVEDKELFEVLNDICKNV